MSQPIIQRGIIPAAGGGGPTPLAYTPRGTNSVKGISSALVIPGAMCNGGALIVSLCYNALLGNTDTVDWGGIPLHLVISIPLGSASQVEMWAAYGLALATHDLTMNISSQSSAIAMAVSEITSLAVAPEDRQAAAAGASGTPSSGPTAVTTQAKEFWWGAIGNEGPSGDTAGTWDNGFTSGQRVGTVGGLAVTNVTIDEGYNIVAATGAATASKSGMAPRSWGALIQTLKGN